MAKRSVWLRRVWARRKGLNVHGRGHILWPQFLLALVTFWLLGSSLCYATSYVYDGNGRLIAVTRNDGTSARYVYDAVGNLQQIAAVPLGQLALFGFTPNHGSPDQVVTITGQGFSATPASNTVAFHGVAATVTAATTSTLSVVVPVAATTGPISVTVGNQTVTSTDSFVIDETGLPPVITSFSPTLASAGTTITLIGQHLDPMLGQTNTAIDGQAATPTTITDTQLTFPVPTTAGSGHISVETPYGVATSNADLVVVPPGISPTDVVAKQRITVGTTQTVSIPTTSQYSKYGVLLFDASIGDWLSFQLNALTPAANNIYYTVYDPQNRALVSGTLSAGSPSIHLPSLSETGTYSIYFQADTAGTTLTVGLEAATILTINAPLTPLTTTIASQSKRYVFSATQGQTLALYMPAASTVPAGNDVSFMLMAPSGGVMVNSSIDGPNTINVPNLPQTGTYQIVLAPPNSATEKVSFQVLNGASGPLAINGASSSFKTAVPDENAYLSFQASPGDNLELALSAVATTSSTGFVYADVYDVNGNDVASQSCDVSSPGASCNLHLWGLTGGAYSVVVQPADTTSTIQFTATLTRDLVATPAIGNATAVSLSTPGQSERLIFTATAGQTVALDVANLATTPAGNPVELAVLQPNGTSLSDTYVSSDSTLNLPNLSAGTYAVVISPQYGLPATASVTLVAGVAGTVVTDGASPSFATTVPGQNAYVTFTAAANDNLELALTNIATTSSSGDVDVQVFDASGNSVAGNDCNTSSSGSTCNLQLSGLTAGTYSIVVQPADEASTLQFMATLSRDVVGTLTGGAPVTVVLQRPGQAERLHFAGIANKTATITTSGTATTPSGECVSFEVLNPDGSELSNWDVCDAGEPEALPTFTASGTYTLLIEPESGPPTQTTVSLN